MTETPGHAEPESVGTPPLVSFIVPAQNVESHVGECLESILGTGRLDVEVILVDDASSDGTPSILAEASSSDPRVRVITNPAPMGAGRSRNAGLALARGSYVWFVDADDWLLEGALEVVLARLDGVIDVLMIDFVRVWSDGRRIGDPSKAVLARAPSRPFRMVDWPAIAQVLHPPWNKIVRRQLLIDHNISFPLGVGSDIPFTYAVLTKARSISVERTVCYAWRTGRPGQITRVGGPQHLVLLDQWRAALTSCADEPVEVQSAVFARMIWHGWSVLSDPIRLRGPLREEFFRRFVALYRDAWRPGLPRNLVLASGSWSLGRARLLTRQARSRMPLSVVLVRDRARTVAVAIREKTRP